MNKNTLVLGGGGLTGIAWMTGILSALEQHDISPQSFSKAIGTSAGSAVAAQIYSEVPIGELYLNQVQSTKQSSEFKPKLNKMWLLFKLLPALFYWKKPRAFRKKVAEIALKRGFELTTQRFEAVKSRLSGDHWHSAVNIVALNAETGDKAVFNQSSNVMLADAVTASCAVPLVWPAHKINGEYFIDGGVRSLNNADLAIGADKVLILSPMGEGHGSFPGNNLQQEITLLESNGAKVFLITPDLIAKQQMGKDPLAPEKKSAAAETGLRQGLLIAQQVSQFLSN
ncbi:patatin-like phospholipase family protein [Thalassotalea crassostreae]|uniref:patatin-like phospholipase family protein n=1 Tax=Thalassotalea crassostreae TaxID=1763536 RepID=UPI00083935CB|nr:patatin-like phospholipase family protein [Thalassotalea crassostreae]